MLANAVVLAEERVRDLPKDTPPQHRQMAYIQLGEARKLLEDHDRDARETKPAVAQQAQDDQAQKCLALRRQLAELEGKPYVAADVEVLEEQLALEWALLGKEG